MFGECNLKAFEIRLECEYLLNFTPTIHWRQKFKGWQQARTMVFASRIQSMPSLKLRNNDKLVLHKIKSKSLFENALFLFFSQLDILNE